MKANELMIEDWVQISEPCKYHGAIGRVKTLIDHKDDENAYFKVFLKNNTIHIGIEDICSDDIKPIPLTAEILEKNGFTRFARTNWHLDTYRPFYLDNPSNPNDYKDNYWLRVGDCMNRIKYVHELQHALRLCGITREIIL